MIVRKILLATGVAALMSTPAWALPSQAPSNQGTGHGPSTPNNTDNQGQHGKDNGKGNHGQGNHGKSHKCLEHKVGYVASGTLVSEALTQDAGARTYSGTLEVEVTHTNHHAAADNKKTVTYSVSKVHVTFGLADTNKDGTVGLDDLAKGDRVHLNGRITTLAPKCDTSKFTATTTINRIVFHAPATTK